MVDAGCGTGRNLGLLQTGFSPGAVGFDFAPEAAPLWPRRGVRNVCLASVNEIPFPSETFDAVLCCDVFECEEVRELEAYLELCRILRPGGHLILVVPALPSLTGLRHDRAIHAVRRYSRKRLLALVRRGPMQMVRASYLFPSFAPLIYAYRIWQRLRDPKGAAPPESDLAPPRPLVNRLLFGATQVERRLFKHVDFPFGSTLLAVLRKNAP